MKTYVRVAVVKARECSRGEYGVIKGIVFQDKDEEGYLVQYESGFMVWIPKGEFEKVFKEKSPESIEEMEKLLERLRNEE